MNEREGRADDTVDHVLRIEEVCDRFEAAWKAGQQPRIEDFVHDCPADERLAILRELIELEVYYRREDYRKRFPELAPASQKTSENFGFASGDRYRFVAFHAKGGMGRVSVYYDREMHRRVAMKELHAASATHTHVMRRFIQEARITGRLEHPNIVPVYELVKPSQDRPPFYTMRFVKGRTLTEAARTYHEKRRGGEPVGLELLTLLNAFVSVCQTVAYAHSQGVVHRDLKGSNVVLGDFGEVIVLDWGLAKLLTTPIDLVDSLEELEEPETPEHTLPGSVTGTPGFLSPEQAAGQIHLIGPQTDVYGLGAILYEILVGQPPFHGSSVLELLDRVKHEDPMPPSASVPDVPAELESACLRALAKQPADRQGSASELAAEVQRWLAESAERNRARQERERFFDLAHDLLCIIGPDDRFMVNLAWEKTLGWTREELHAFGYLEIVHPDDRDETRKAVKRVASGVGRPWIENRYRCKDGGYRWIRWTGSLIPGEHLVYAVGHDVTEQKNAVLALRRSQERFELAVLGSGVGIWDWDRETGESYYSPRWKSMIGYEDHEISHDIAEWESRLHPDDRDRALAAIRTCTEGDATSYEVEYRFRHKNGSYVWILDRGVAVRNATGVIRMAGSHTDISERKRLDQELRDHGQFASGESVRP